MSDTTIDRLLAERDWLARLARRLVDDDATAADLAQDTWVTALSRPPAHPRGLRGWLATVLRHRAHDRRRREQSETRRVEKSNPPESMTDPAEVVARAEIEHRVAELTLILPPIYRDVLLLRYYEGLSPAEIAESTRTPPGTVRSRLKRGLDMLRERLDGHHDGERQTWVVALIPLARRATPEKTAMFTLPLKLALVTGTLVLGGSAALFAVPTSATDDPPVQTAEAPIAVAGVGAEPRGPGTGGESETNGEAPQAGEKAGKKGQVPLDTKTSVDFQDLSLPGVLEFLTDVSGVQFEVAEDVGERVITLRADDISVRNVLELVTMTCRLQWKLRSDGSVLISKEPEKKEPPMTKAPRAWFGSPSGFFDPAPVGSKETAIRLPESDVAEHFPTVAIETGLRIRLGADGTAWIGTPAKPGRFEVWRALQSRPEAPVILHADTACPVEAVIAARRLAGGHECWLATSDDAGLRLSGQRPEGEADVRLFAHVLRPEPGAKPMGPKGLYEGLYQVRAANPGRRIDMFLRIDTNATAGHVAVLLGEARRFGLVVARLSPVSDTRPAGNRPLQYVLNYPPETAVSQGSIPPKQKGVIVAPSPAMPAPRASKYAPAMVSGRAGLRNLRANGGGAKTKSAVDWALSWLASQQAENGSWGDDVGDTAAALLALLADPSSRTGKPYAGALDRGLMWLAKAKDDRGDCAIVFAEAWALTKDPRWREAAESALERTRSAAARRIGHCCGIDSPQIESASPGTTPFACFGRILDGEVPWKSGSLATAMNKFLEPVKDDPDALRGANPRFLHDATLAAFQAGGESWVRWMAAMKREILTTQHMAGDAVGSWTPPEGMSRVRATALNSATLSVFYRYPRLFRRIR